MQMRLFEPARIKKTLIASELKEFIYLQRSKYLVQEKIDGARYLLYIGNKGCRLLSRNISQVTNTYVDKSGNAPHIADPTLCSIMPGTVLDGEIVWGHNSSDVTKIMGCVEEEAVRRQKEDGWVTFQVFDVLQYKGKIVTGYHTKHRDTILSDIMQELQPYVSIFRVPSYEGDPVSLYNSVISMGGEGIVLKPKDTKYGDGWIKVKKVITVDAFITGYEAGVGKYYGQVGSLLFSMMKNGRETYLGKCSGMTDDLRKEISIRRAAYMGRVIEVAGQEISGDFTLRHPRFVKFRDDKRKEDCIYDEQLNIKGALI